MAGLTFSLSFRFNLCVLDALAFYIESGDYRPVAEA